MKIVGMVLGWLMAAVGNTALASDFTVEHLHVAAKSATDMFKGDYGATAFNAIYGIQATKGNESARVKLFYREGSTPRTIEYFCHFHQADELDCHEH